MLYTFFYQLFVLKLITSTHLIFSVPIHLSGPAGKTLKSVLCWFSGTICSSNPTAQPADVLIQQAPPHRRARSPAWSYHFYPDESWVELTLTLPCAVLLKEVHLQPHLTSLASQYTIVAQDHICWV